MMSQKNNAKVKSGSKMRLAIFISGIGTTMEAIIKACRSGALTDVEPVLVISSLETAPGIQKAMNLGIPKRDILAINPKKFVSKEEFGKKLIAECLARKANFIAQCGWLVFTPENVIKKFDGRIINQHNGPLDTGRPDFGGPGMYGLRVHETRLEFVIRVNRDFWTEATTHRVTSKFDEGAIMGRRQVPISIDDTAETMSARILPVEHELLIETLRKITNGTVAEFRRKIPLVLPGEENILMECKEIAKKLYPHG